MRRFCASVPNTTTGFRPKMLRWMAEAPDMQAPEFGHRLHQEGRLGDAETGAAVFLRHGDAEPVAFGHGGKERIREGRGPVALQPVGVVEAAAELQHLVADLLLLVGQGEVHGRAFQALAGWAIYVPCITMR